MEGREIGEGTFGQVTVENGKAVKLFKADNIDERFESADESFINEVSSYLRLRGKSNIVTMDSYSINPYIIRMTLYKESLNVYLEEKKSYLNKSKIAYDILVALHNQFTVGILHGDIKPANILLTNRGAVITDYGLAQYNSIALVYMNSYIYTIFQRPPECIKRGLVVDFAADMWAYGILLLEIFINDYSFPGIDDESQLTEWHNAIATDGEVSNNNKYLSLKDMVSRGALTSAEYNLVSRLLYIDPSKRATPVELSSDPYFAGFRPINFVPYKDFVVGYKPIVSTYSQVITDGMYQLDKTLNKVIATDVKSVQLLKRVFESTFRKKFRYANFADPTTADMITAFGYLIQFVYPENYDLLLYIISRVHNYDYDYYTKFDKKIDITNIPTVMNAIGSGFSVFPLRILYHEASKEDRYDFLKSQEALVQYISDMKHLKKSLVDVIKACLIVKQ